MNDLMPQAHTLESLSGLDIGIVAIYMAAIFILAQTVSRGKPAEAMTTGRYFFASHQLPFWAVGTSIIAANISAEQIIGMSGSGYRIGLAVASYEWMAALTLIVVGKYILPVFFHTGVMTMPGFLQLRFGSGVKNLMAVFWLCQYVLINLTGILWLGGTAVSTITGIDTVTALVGLGVFALLYQVKGGLRASALTDVVQVAILITGGMVILAMTLCTISGDWSPGGALQGFGHLLNRHPDHFKMILPKESPYYNDLPGIAVLIGGMWIMNLSYFGFNQYIVQRALAAKSLPEAQTGIVFSAYLKLLMPLIVVLPGMTAFLLAPGLARGDMAYPTMMTLLPPGLLGLVFAALIAAIVASSASKINSIATIMTLDLVKPAFPALIDRHLLIVGRATAVGALLIAVMVAKPLLGHFDQVFQFGQNLTGFFAPGIVVIFLLGLFWRGCSPSGALAGIITGITMSAFFFTANHLHQHPQAWGMDWRFLTGHVPFMPFLNRVGWVFWITLCVCIGVSKLLPDTQPFPGWQLKAGTFKTSRLFNLMSLGVILILIALYAVFW